MPKTLWHSQCLKYTVCTFISHHITTHHITDTHTHITDTHTQGCQDDLGIPLILMDIKIISALIRQNALEYKNKKGLKTICRRGYRYAEMTQLRTANYQFYTTKFCLGSITLHQNIFLTLMMEWNTTVSSQSER